MHLKFSFKTENYCNLKETENVTWVSYTHKICYHSRNFHACFLEWIHLRVLFCPLFECCTRVALISDKVLLSFWFFLLLPIGRNCQKPINYNHQLLHYFNTRSSVSWIINKYKDNLTLLERINTLHSKKLCALQHHWLCAINFSRRSVSYNKST